MGCYDMVSVKCNKCGKYTEPQTKSLGDDCLQTFNVGDDFDSDLFDYRTCILELKDSCEHCKATLKIKIPRRRSRRLADFQLTLPSVG